MTERSINRPSSIVAKRLTLGALQSITRLSEFRKFLMVNRDAIQAASGGFRISWQRFLDLPEVKALNFRDATGKPISPDLAAAIWHEVRAKADVASEVSEAIEASVPAREVRPSQASVADGGQTGTLGPVAAQRMKAVLTDLVNADYRSRGKTTDAARRIAARISQESEDS